MGIKALRGAVFALSALLPSFVSVIRLCLSYTHKKPYMHPGIHFYSFGPVALYHNQSPHMKPIGSTTIDPEQHSTTTYDRGQVDYGN